MKKKFSFAIAMAVAPVAFGQSTVQTPEQLAGPGGQIPNESVQDYYYGQLTFGQSDSENIVGDEYPNQPSMAWYKYVSDGTSPVIFDMFGSNMTYGVGGFGSTNDGVIAVYSSQGNLVADNKGGEGPAQGDSNVVPVVPPGDPNPPQNFRQPLDPTSPTYVDHGGTWYAENYQGLSQIAFVKNPQTDPQRLPSSPNYNPYANWNQFPILPAGTYFLAVSGYETYFSGDPNDAASISADGSEFPISPGVYPTPTTPFGFVSFNPFNGTSELNVRLAGDFNGDGVVDSTDLALLRNKIETYLHTQGIPNDVDGWTPSQGLNGLPDSVRQFDLTGNTRIDQNDLLAWGNYTGLSTNLSITWNNTGGYGDGVTWDVQNNGNFANSTGSDLFYNGDTVTFNDNNNGNYAITLNSAVAPAAVTFSNNSNNYSVSGFGAITGSASLTVSGTAMVTLSTVNSYVGGTIVSSGTLVAAAAGAIPSDSALSIASIGTVKLAAGIGTATFSALNVARGGKLDVTNNAVIINFGTASDPIATIRSYLADGSASGWTAGEILSSTVSTLNATQSKLIYSIGYADGADGVVSGLPSGEIEILPTLAGDAKMAGNVVFGDFQLLAANFGKSAGWDGGNFTYGSVVNFGDFQVLAQNFGANSSGLTMSEVASLNSFASAFGETLIANSDGVGFQLVSVPEPSTAAILTVAGFGVLKRSRRRISRAARNF